MKYTSVAQSLGYPPEGERYVDGFVLNVPLRVELTVYLSNPPSIKVTSTSLHKNGGEWNEMSIDLNINDLANANHPLEDVNKKEMKKWVFKELDKYFLNDDSELVTVIDKTLKTVFPDNAENFIPEIIQP